MVAGRAGRLPRVLSAVWERAARALPRRLRASSALELPQHHSGSAPATTSALTVRLLRSAIPGRPVAD